MIDLDELERMVAEAGFTESLLAKPTFDDRFWLGWVTCGGVFPADIHAVAVHAAVNALPALIERVRRAEEALKPLAEVYLGGWTEGYASTITDARIRIDVLVQQILDARAHFAAYTPDKDD